MHIHSGPAACDRPHPGRIRCPTMSQLKVGLVGSGGISHSHAPHWVTLGADVRVFSLVGADELAEEFGLTVADTREELFEWADVVDICTPTRTHAEIALAAIAVGTHVLCEKPLGRTTDEARAVAAATRAAGVQVYPAHVVRYFPEYVALHAAVADGKIGIPAVLRFSRGRQAVATR